jgi:succinate-semialdehyde dehydrogenase/glutarate-semialdehyde dehydrogenase
MAVYNLATGERIDCPDPHDEAAVEAALSAARERFEHWSGRPVTERAQLLDGLATRLSEEQEGCARLMTREMGKPITQSRAEIEKCAWVCSYYAEHAAEMLQDKVVGAEPDAETRVVHEPLGPVLAVMPWNYPFWQVFRFAAPTIAAGNVALVSHAPSVPGCAERIESLFDASLPDNVLTNLRLDEERTRGLIDDERIAGVTLTGSVAAGRAVAEAAGRALKPSVMELGGSDPFLVLEDAPLDRAARVGARSRLHNSGQTCIAAKRFLVVEDVYDAFLDRLVAAIEGHRVGDPTDPDTAVGPLARADLRETLASQVERTVEAGGTVLTGGQAPDRDGYFYEPTVITDVPADCPAAGDEELFGPVAVVQRVADTAAAIQAANDTPYGLGASVWTGDVDRGKRVARELQAGATFVNELVKSDPRLPFGGIKQSGYGRELGTDGIRAFVNRKTLWVDRSPPER